MTNIVTTDTFKTIRSAVNKAVDLVKVTYGPSSNKVLVDKVTHKLVIDDGVQVMRDIEFDDINENAVLRVIRETAVKTNDRVGDGTTGAMIMLQSIIEEVAKLEGKDRRAIEKELKVAVGEVKTQLLKMAKPVKTKEELRKVARISFDDEKISEVIADTWYKLGHDAHVTVDRSGTMETYADIVEGIKINKGFLSPYMVTNPSRMEGVIEKPYILLTDYRLTEVNDVFPIMNELLGKQIQNLVIICDNLESQALSTVIINKIQGKFNAIAINKPHGDTTLDDIALMTGAKLFSQKKGDKLETAKIEDLGRAERFISKQTESVIVGPIAKKGAIQKAIGELGAAIALAPNERVRTQLKERQAFFSNKIAVIKVGAPTENEVNVLKYKVDDAVNATKAAYKGGVIPGAGIALSSLKTSSEILNNALKAPFRQLQINVGLAKTPPLAQNEAINVVTGEVGQFLKVGVVDPVDVIIAGVESAVSIACILITTKGMIVEEPVKMKTE